MYAEIKSNNKIVVNRLDSSERILLKDICDRANEDGKEVKLNALTDECGDFGGVFIEIKDIEPEPTPEPNIEPEENNSEENNPEED